MSSPLFIIVDLFCGAGGTTTGFVQATLEGKSIAKVIACINHDPIAIKSHWANHPEVKHYEEDIRTLDLTDLIDVVKFQRSLYPNAYLILWASLECTNFSKAKGGQPRDADSRTLADHLERYVKAIDPDYVQIENVVEFMSWGPLDENGKPISRKSGTDWMRWRREMCELGYKDEWKELNSANFGAYTSRNRLFGVFAKHGLPIVFPEPTHAKNPTKLSMYGDFHKWKAVKEVLHFHDKGNSIIVRKKPLTPKSLDRVYDGLITHVANGETSFITKYFSGKQKGITVNEPIGTLTTVDHHALVQTQFLSHYYGNGYNTSINEPAPTITTKDRCAIIQCESYILNPSHGGHSTSIENPCPVIVARQDKAPLYLVQIEKGSVAIPVYQEDSEPMIRIKQFMAAYNLADIKMRMLRVHEMLNIQGFPTTYKLEGNQADQKKFIGNSVVPKVVKVWAEAMGYKLIQYRLKENRA